MEHTISEAARLAGKSRRTIYAHISSGKLSAKRNPEGKQVIDTSELMRVYGALHDSHSEDETEQQAETVQMQAEIERLRELLQEREQVNQLLREQNGNLMRLLEDQRPRRSGFGTLADALAERIKGRAGSGNQGNNS